MFIAIDGADGVGKGRQIDLLREWFLRRSLPTLFVRDPGSTELGESVRKLLLDHKEYEIATKTEAALFMACRAQLVREKIAPALEDGLVVVVDRYLLSTVVYQGFANDFNADEIARLWQIGSYFADFVLPDLTFVLDCPLDVAERRLQRAKDRIESKDELYRAKVVEGFRRAVGDWKAHSPGKAYLIDGTASPEQVFAQISTILAPRVDALQRANHGRLPR